MEMREYDEPGPLMTNRHRAWFAGILVVVALCLVTLTCSSCATVPRPQGLSQLYRPTVFVLRSGSGQCTAWKLSSDTIATAGHCCEDGSEYTLSGVDVPFGELQPPKMLVDDDVHDVCVLRARVSGRAIELADEEPDVGDPVWTAGYPRGWFLISAGHWSGRDADNEGVCSVVVAGGASGSPILDRRGRAVGVLVKRVNGMDNLTLVSPLEWLRRAVTVAELSGGEPVRLEPQQEPDVEMSVTELDRLLQDILKSLPQ